MQDSAPTALILTEHDVNENSDTDASGASRIENYGATAQGDEPLSRSTESENTELLQINAEDETAITATTGVSSLLSNTSASSHYFQQTNEFRPGPRRPCHNSTDSLDYSITSDVPTPNNHDNRTSGSYVGSIERSLLGQQAFPSSMFPGQRLISPTNEEENAIEIPEDAPGYPSFYYFPKSPNKSPHTTTTTKSYNQKYLPLPSYQKVSRNVYQKRQNPVFCPVDGDLEFCGTDDKTLASSWTKCWRCFFSPRVLITLAVCGVIVFNLLRLGEQHEHYYQRLATATQNPSVRGGATSNSSSGIDAEYVKLRVIGTNESNP